MNELSKFFFRIYFTPLLYFLMFNKIKKTEIWQKKTKKDFDANRIYWIQT